ncbi:MAG: DUF2237 family protein [Devosia sp.]|jgi:uncharacterized protein (DUF2237 family)
MSLEERNVFGERLVPCSTDPMTGFFRTGACAAGPDDTARHLICCEMTAEFLAFSKSVGNDLSTPHPEWGFPGLEPGDRWCLVAARWVEAHEAGAAPRVALLSTHEGALRYTDLKTLKAYALDLA